MNLPLPLHLLMRLICKIVYGAHKPLKHKDQVRLLVLQMITTIFITLTISIGVSIILALSPLTIGLWILILALFTATVTALSISSWFGFIVFLIYIGGILVIFAYFAATQPNQQLKLAIPLSATVITAILLPTYINPSTVNQFPRKSWWISSLYDITNISSLTFLALTLFLALIRVVKVSYLNRSPLRPFSYV